MDSKTADAAGSSERFGVGLEGEAIAFSVKERIAFCDFLVPKAWPRTE